MKRILASLLLMTLLVALSAGLQAQTTTNAEYAQSVFEMMYAGDLSVIPLIDWANLIIIGADYGSDFRSLTTEEQRRGYQEIFLSSFSDVCDEASLTPDNLSDWSLDYDSETAVSVYADFYPDWLYLDFVKRDGRMLLDTISVETDEGY